MEKMIIPKRNRSQWYRDLIDQMQRSAKNRCTAYTRWMNYHLYGSSSGESRFNKIGSHIDVLSSFLFAQDQTRFTFSFHDSNPENVSRLDAVMRHFGRRWSECNADQVIADSVPWALTYGSRLFKVIWNDGLRVYGFDPDSFGVIREDITSLEDQEGMVMSFTILRSELVRRFGDHPRISRVISSIPSAGGEDSSGIPAGLLNTIVTSTTPNLVGAAGQNESTGFLYTASLSPDLVRVDEALIYDDEKMDYRLVKMAGNILLSEILNPSALKDTPYVIMTPKPLYNYFWGQSEVAKLTRLQDWRNRRMIEIDILFQKQLNPPYFYTGNGAADEKIKALYNPGSTFFGMPGDSVKDLTPQMPSDAFAVLNQIDSMFEEASGIFNILRGQGESGVRSDNHASTLARLASSRIKKQAMIIENAINRLATLMFKALIVHDRTELHDDQGKPFYLAGLDTGWSIQVDGHSSSPVWLDGDLDKAEILMKAGAISPMTFLEMVDPPRLPLLRKRLEEMEAQQAKFYQEHPELLMKKKT